MWRHRLRPFILGLIAGVILMGAVHVFVCYRTVVWPVAIKRITSNTRAYEGKVVMVTGRVGRSFGLLSYGAYTVDDGTGSITVLSDAGVPETGRAVRVRGIVMSLVIENVRMVVLFEKHL